MQIKTEIINGKELADKFKQAGKTVQDKIDKALLKAGLLVERDIKKSFGVSPSPPGAPPGVVTGRLRASIATRLIPANAEVGTKVTYARDLEFGDEDRNLAPRPFMRPALERNEAKIKEILREGLSDVMSDIFKKGKIF